MRLIADHPGSNLMSELSQVEYVRIVDYGLTDALPTPGGDRLTL